MVRLCLLGWVGYLALNQLWLWKKSPMDRTYAWSAVWFVVAGLLLVGRIIQHTATTPEGGAIGVRMVAAGAMLVVPPLIGGMYAMAGSEWSRLAKVVFAMMMLTVALMGFTNVFAGLGVQQINDATGDPIWVAKASGSAVGALILYFLAATVWGLRSLRKAHDFVDARGRLVLAIPGVLAFLATINDGLLHRGFIVSVQLADYGVTALAVAVSYVHIRRSALYLSELERTGALRGKFLERVIDAQEQERRRIARDLHDATAQSLTSISVRLSTLEQDPKADRVRSSIAEVRTLAKATLNEVREIATGLHPTVLDDLGFEEAIENYAREFTRSHGVETDIHMNGFRTYGRLPGSIELVLYRIAQEALTNVAKHAEATTVSILVDRNDDGVRMILEDDGRGFDAGEHGMPKDERYSIGLHSIRERASLCDGTATFESSRGAGTTLYVQIPVVL